VGKLKEKTKSIPHMSENTVKSREFEEHSLMCSEALPITAVFFNAS